MTEAGTTTAREASGVTRHQQRVFEIVELEPGIRSEAVNVLADAFLDDPAWVAIGPRNMAARRRLLGRYYDILIGEALRWAGPIWCALRGDVVVGVALTYEDGTRFPPPYATVREAPPFLRAGPGPGLRGAWVDFVMKRAHPHDDHLLLWYLAAHPSVQRQGVGRALLDHVRSHAQRAHRPIYLDTTKLENVAYYRAHGYRQIGEARLLRGARVWFMYLEHPGERTETRDAGEATS